MNSSPVNKAGIPLKGWHMLSIFIVLATMLILFLFNPAQSGFFPRCLFKVSTGLDCPGCGGLRAAHQMLHGNVGAAFSLNPLLVLLLPVFGLILLNQLVQRTRGRPLFAWKVSASFLWTLFVVVVAFTVLRNLPIASFSWMASSS